jgi:hypothetical protein
VCYPDPLFGQTKPGTDLTDFPPFAFFQHNLLARFVYNKTVTLIKQSPQRYLKGIIEWYVKGVPSLTCRIKNENESPTVIHDVC